MGDLNKLSGNIFAVVPAEFTWLQKFQPGASTLGVFVVSMTCQKPVGFRSTIGRGLMIDLCMSQARLAV
jgi:hypothetical protein